MKDTFGITPQTQKGFIILMYSLHSKQLRHCHLIFLMQISKLLYGKTFIVLGDRMHLII